MLVLECYSRMVLGWLSCILYIFVLWYIAQKQKCRWGTTFNNKKKKKKNQKKKKTMDNSVMKSCNTYMWDRLSFFLCVLCWKLELEWKVVLYLLWSMEWSQVTVLYYMMWRVCCACEVLLEWWSGMLWELFRATPFLFSFLLVYCLQHNVPCVLLFTRYEWVSAGHFTAWLSSAECDHFYSILPRSCEFIILLLHYTIMLWVFLCNASWMARCFFLVWMVLYGVFPFLQQSFLCLSVFCFACLAAAALEKWRV